MIITAQLTKGLNQTVVGIEEEGAGAGNHEQDLVIYRKREWRMEEERV